MFKKTQVNKQLEKERERERESEGGREGGRCSFWHTCLHRACIVLHSCHEPDEFASSATSWLKTHLHSLQRKALRSRSETETVRDQRAVDAAKIIKPRDRLSRTERTSRTATIEGSRTSTIDRASKKYQNATRTDDQTYQTNRYHGQETGEVDGKTQANITSNITNNITNSISSSIKILKGTINNTKINSGKDSATNSNSTITHNSNNNGDLLKNSNGALVPSAAIIGTEGTIPLSIQPATGDQLNDSFDRQTDQVWTYAHTGRGTVFILITQHSPQTE